MLNVSEVIYYTYCMTSNEQKTNFYSVVLLIGVTFCARISPTIVTRVVESARGILNKFIPDVYIHTDHYRGADGGASAGYSLALVAESTNGSLLSAERTAMQGELPEDIGRQGAFLLLEEIRKGGLVDSSHQSLVLQLMIMGPEDVCKVRMGDLTEQAIESLRLIRDAFGVMFKIKQVFLITIFCVFFSLSFFTFSFYFIGCRD